MLAKQHLRMDFKYFQYFEYAALIAAIIYARDLRRHSLHLMIGVMLVACVMETLAVNANWFGWKTTYVVNDLYFLLTVPLYLVTFQLLLQFRENNKLLYLIGSALTVVFMLIDFFYLEKLQVISYTVTLTAIIFIFLSGVLLFRLMSEERRKVTLVSEPYFWFAAGTIIFDLGIV